MVSSVFDPLGFLGPFMLPAKRILQELCKLQLGWDEQIPEVYSARWRLWLQDLEKLSSFTVDRCMKPAEFGSVTSARLHHFSDASEVGYGVATYLRLENSEGKVHCSFLLGKSRVSPLKQITIPRLELTAATVAVRMDKMLKDELDVTVGPSMFWTDSMTVLRYIQNRTARFHTFVANRIAVIHEGSEPIQWRYVNTKVNPADQASRGINSTALLRNSEWISGPQFLWTAEDDWPGDIPGSTDDVLSGDPEVKSVTVNTVKVGEVVADSSVTTAVDKLINYHSSWYTLKRSVAWIIKIRTHLLERHQNDEQRVSGNTPKVVRVTVEDMHEAEMAILRYVQQQAFAGEISTSREGVV
ncbi:PREDICTED: uncharacterized protein LOC106814173 [Priapulus caudatus]|uniref:Uncharacterized protein LOC106814173 n=1 Tax=Priapulus caudatus TaxID=37621 RepID=A0ABM1EP34_PRICU|nr:PREDICTED: uncharacterized protein LOC106814173 [Priapulus caudatus]